MDAKKLNYIMLNQAETDQAPEAIDPHIIPTAFALNSYIKNRYIYLLFKRTFDLSVGSIAIVLLLPLFVLIAIAIKLESRGPVFFVQARVGRGLIFFNIFKFRTMHADTLPVPMFLKDQKTNELRRPNIEEDARITKVGRILRAFSLDELPQLMNILSGDMSFIGPRPLTIDESLKVPTEAICRYKVKPGLSGLAQVRNRSAVHSSSRFNGDIEYVIKKSVFFDLKLFFISFTKFYNYY
jgi:lipopolysaccharide/colanic/teichoic acid biosynthesis glycosyltransferase